MKFTQHFTKGAIKTLDVACGGGAFSIVAAKNGNHVMGVDYDERNIKVCHEYRAAFNISEAQAKFQTFNIKALHTLNDVYDQVFCFEILEHMMDDDAIVASISKITKPGSKLLISVPNLHHKPLYKEEVSPVENGEHVRFGYSFEQLEKLVAKHGFEVKMKDSCAGMMSQWVTSFEGICADKLFDGKPPRWFSAILFVLLYPLTYLDGLFGGEPMCIFVLAEKVR
ncbi:MAG: class I SAM-dependent methyltransferase [Chloroherpetonaceae bacterium]